MGSEQKLYFSRWAVLASCSLASSVVATAYAFGAFSREFQACLGYDQLTIDLVQSIGETGLFLEVFCGLFLEFTGPRETILMGLVLNFVGFFYLYAAGEHLISSTLTSVSAMYFLSQFGSSFITAVTTSISIRNFPESDRGKVAGLIKAQFGLSSAILTQLYFDFFGGDVVHFLRFLAIYIAISLLVAVLQVNVLHPSNVPYYLERKMGWSVSFKLWFAQLFCLLSFVLVSGFLSNIIVFSHAVKLLMGVTTIAFQASILILPCFHGTVMLPRSSRTERSSAGSKACENANSVCDVDCETDFLTPKTNRDSVASSDDELEQEREYTFSIVTPDLNLWEVLRTQKFWALFFLFFCGGGSSFIVMNNIQQIAASLGIVSSSYPVLVLGVSNCLGRAMVGWFSDIIFKYIPRTALLCFETVLVGITCFVFAIDHPAVFYPCLISMGFFSGGLFTIVPALAGDLFGATHVAVNYGALDLSPALGGFLFATWLVSVFYTDNCQDCFAPTLTIAGLCCLVASCVVYFIIVDEKTQKRISFGVSSRLSIFSAVHD